MGDVGKLLNNQKFDHVNVSKTISWTGFSKMFLGGKEWFKITEMKKQKTGYDAVERKY